MRPTKLRRLLAVAMSLALVGTACGDDDDSGGEDTETTDSGSGAAAELEPAPGFDGTTIRVGALENSGAPLAAIGRPLTAGNQAYFDHINSQGGIAGKYPIELVKEETGYNPTTAGEKFAATVDNVAMYVQILGTPVVDALLGDLEEQNVIAGPASLDADWVLEPNLLPVGGPYQIQAINAVDWYFSQEGNDGDVLCTLSSDDEYGDAGVQGVDFIAEELGIEVAQKSQFPTVTARGGPAYDFSGQVRELEDADCDVVFAVTTLFDTEGLANAFTGRPGFTPTVIGQSPSWQTGFANIPFIRDHFLLAGEGPAYGDRSVPGMDNLITIREEYAPETPPDIYFNFGVVQAMATVALLEKAVELGDLSREGLATALDELGTVDFQGLTGDYTYGPPEDRVPPLKSTVFKPNPDGANYPTGLEVVAQDYEAEAAKDFEFGGS